MKAKLAMALLLGLVVCRSTPAQNTTPAGETPAVAAPAATDAAPSAPAMRINLQDSPLTAAIETLARQAGINYILDPKVNYGQPDEKGVVRPQPSISIRWENVTAEQALTTLLNNYSLQLVEDPKTKISRVTVKDPAQPDPLVTKIVQLKYANVSNMVAAVQAAFTDKRGKVVPDGRTSQLVIVATEKEHLAINELVERLDKPTKQVLIEARIMEISHSPSTVKGIDWSGTLKGQNFSFGNGQVQSANTIFQAPGNPTTITLPGGRTITTSPDFSSSTTVGGAGAGGAGDTGGTGGTTGGGVGGVAGQQTGGLIPNGLSVNTLAGLSPAIGFLNADGVHAVLSFLNEEGDATVLSTPRAVTLDNETATISVTRAEPIFKNTAGTQGSPGGSQVEYTNLGTILQVTPRVSADDKIYLKVVPEVSSKGGTVTKTVAGTINQADQFDIRKIETQVLIPSANTLVMGGLVSDTTVNTYNKVPVLGDLPIFGLAFRHESKARLKKNLLIFITPTIVQDTDFQPSQSSQFLKSRPTEITGGIDASKAWESGKPYDWSNPEATRFEDAVFDESAVEPKAPPPPPPAEPQPKS